MVLISMSVLKRHADVIEFANFESGSDPLLTGKGSGNAWPMLLGATPLHCGHVLAKWERKNPKILIPGSQSSEPSVLSI